MTTLRVDLELGIDPRIYCTVNIIQAEQMQRSKQNHNGPPPCGYHPQPSLSALNQECADSSQDKRPRPDKNKRTISAIESFTFYFTLLYFTISVFVSDHTSQACASQSESTSLLGRSWIDTMD